MKKDEGKTFLQNCINRVDDSRRLEELIVYKYGNRVIENYQQDAIDAKLTDDELNVTALFVVKCFLHDEVFAAWDINIGRGSGKYTVYKNMLLDYCRQRDSIQELQLGNGGSVILFSRDNDLGDMFIREHVFRLRDRIGIKSIIQ